VNNKYQAALAWFASAAGAGVPAWSFFTHYNPPIFPAVGLLLAPVSAALIVFAGAQRRGGSRKMLKGGMILVGVGFVLILAYGVALSQWTVFEPQHYQTRFQIGFGLADWSLTSVGLSDKKEIPAPTPEQLMMAEAAFSPEGAEKIWSAWSITSAGALLLAFYCLGFVLWTSGFAWLAKFKAESTQ
jgi:hypothetical protein